MTTANRFREPGREVRKLLSRLIVAVSEDLRERLAEDRDSFELYALQLRARLYERNEHFRRQFLRGYEILLRELKEKGVPPEKGEDLKIKE